MSILNESRENAEKILDFLHKNCPRGLEKPRDYRQNARRDFLAYTKKRKHSNKSRRAAIKKQLNYLKRDMRYIDELLCVVEPGSVPYRVLGKIKVLRTVLGQQKEMYRKNERKVANRIVSVSQPHVRPIVRGKAGTPTEFGAKISLSLSDGFSFVDRLSWDAYNEAGDLQFQVEKYRKRHGYYPESVHADHIYRNRENLSFCKERGIRLSGKPLGRPRKKTEDNKDELLALKKQRYQDDIDRIAVEGRFGVAKRKYGMGKIKSKLRETSETEILLSVLVMNLDKMCSVEIDQNKMKYRILRRKAS